MKFLSVLNVQHRFGACLLFALLSSQHVSAQTATGSSSPNPASSISVERFTPGSIDSLETADRLLSDVEKARADIEASYTMEDQACRAKFFMTACTDRAKEKRRKGLVQLDPVEVEANTYKRAARAAHRDKLLADKNVKQQLDANPALPLNKQDQAKEAAVSIDNTPKPEQADNATGSARQSNDERVAQHRAKLERLAAQEQSEQEKRARNIEKREKRLQKSLERQKEIAEKKASRDEANRSKASAPAAIP